MQAWRWEQRSASARWVGWGVITSSKINGYSTIKSAVRVWHFLRGLFWWKTSSRRSDEVLLLNSLFLFFFYSCMICYSSGSEPIICFSRWLLFASPGWHHRLHESGLRFMRDVRRAVFRDRTRIGFWTSRLNSSTCQILVAWCDDCAQKAEAGIIEENALKMRRSLYPAEASEGHLWSNQWSDADHEQAFFFFAS